MKFLRIAALLVAAATLAGCSACNSFYLPGACRSGPQPAQDRPPPGR